MTAVVSAYLLPRALMEGLLRKDPDPRSMHHVQLSVCVCVSVKIAGYPKKWVK